MAPRPAEENEKSHSGRESLFRISFFVENDFDPAVPEKALSLSRKTISRRKEIDHEKLGIESFFSYFYLR